MLACLAWLVLLGAAIVSAVFQFTAAGFAAKRLGSSLAIVPALMRTALDFIAMVVVLLLLAYFLGSLGLIIAILTFGGYTIHNINQTVMVLDAERMFQAHDRSDLT